MAINVDHLIVDHHYKVFNKHFYTYANYEKSKRKRKKITERRKGLWKVNKVKK